MPFHLESSLTNVKFIEAATDQSGIHKAIKQSAWASKSILAVRLISVGESECWPLVTGVLADIEGSDEKKSNDAFATLWDNYFEWKLQVRDQAMPEVVDKAVIKKLDETYDACKGADGQLDMPGHYDTLTSLLGHVRKAVALIEDKRLTNMLTNLSQVARSVGARRALSSVLEACDEVRSVFQDDSPPENFSENNCLKLMGGLPDTNAVAVK